MDYIKAKDPEEDLKPGDIFANAPLHFPLIHRLIARKQQDGSYQAHSLGDAPGGPWQKDHELIEMRLSYAILHPLTPPCDIDKMIQPKRQPGWKQPLESEEHVLTFFHCRERRTMEQIWQHKLKHPDDAGGKRYHLIGALPTSGNGKSIELAISFRREQQLCASVVKDLSVIATLTDDGLKAYREAWLEYLELDPTK